MTTEPRPGDPQAVPVSGSDTEGIKFKVTTPEAASVAATASGTGLTISDADQVLAADASQAKYGLVPRRCQHARVSTR